MSHPEPPTIRVTLPRGMNLTSFSFAYNYDPDFTGPIRFEFAVMLPPVPVRARKESEDINDMYSTPKTGSEDNKENVHHLSDLPNVPCSGIIYRGPPGAVRPSILPYLLPPPEDESREDRKVSRVLQRSLKTARKGIKKPGTTTFFPEPSSSKSVQVDAEPADAATVACEALARISERCFRNHQWQKKSPSTILHRETATIIKTRIHSTFQGSKVGNISHSRLFIPSAQSSTQPLVLGESLNNISPTVDPERWVYSPDDVFTEEHYSDQRSRK
ncbi:hypothetical protein JVT61DRAFT_3393 [Boletus reticuloceps]|uniref:Uncharacterized protein n=1 Tax=Boletus reticuloceps TaxID=495285 RepID=A0A8I2YMA9_9AGAM|nr:hypothetical protein JVT61DRAFT_3393 [Boletus reticuloceps]